MHRPATSYGMDLNNEQFQETETYPLAELASAPAKKPVSKSDKGGAGILTVDVYQTPDDIIIKSTIAGVSSDDLDISVTNEMVTIKGSRKPEDRVAAGSYYHQELYYGPFSRSILLPEEIDADTAKANLKSGVLTLKLPKLARTKIKKLRIT